MILKTQLHAKSNQNANPQTDENSCFSSLTQTLISNRHIPPLKYLSMSSSTGNQNRILLFLEASVMRV